MGAGVFDHGGDLNLFTGAARFNVGDQAMTTWASDYSYCTNAKTGAIIQHQRRTGPVCNRCLDTGILILRDTSWLVICEDCNRASKEGTGL